MSNLKKTVISLDKFKEKIEGLFTSKKDTTQENKFKNINPKIALACVMLVSIIGLSFAGYKINDIRTRAFDVYLGEDKVGTVRQEEDVELIMEDLKSELSSTYNMEVVLKRDINLEQTNVKDDLITSKKDLKKVIESKMSFLVEAYVLSIDGEEVGALATKKEIEEVIEDFKKPFEEDLEEGMEVEEIKILEDIEIVKKETPLYKISTKENLYNNLLTGSEEIKTHIVEVGESLWTISKIYNMDVEELEEANPDKTPEKIQIGDEVKLIVPKSMLTVQIVAQVEYTEQVDFESEVEYDDSMYTNEKKVKVDGENGLAKIVAKEVKNNGVLVDKEIIKEEIVETPVNELVVRGTKEVPKTVATGAFLMPTRGRISSRYGMRNGRMHRGLDIAAGTGTPINASDGGKVVFASYRGAYGNLVEIDHGNGYRSRYAHCSKILVNVGDKVYKGQHIANIGNTGRSTGPHVHLEILKNGSNENPSNYVN